MTSLTRVSPMPSPRASGATQSEISQTSSFSSSCSPRTIPASPPSRTATNVGKSSSCFTQDSCGNSDACSCVVLNDSGDSSNERSRMDWSRSHSLGESRSILIGMSRGSVVKNQPDNSREWTHESQRLVNPPCEWSLDITPAIIQRFWSLPVVELRKPILLIPPTQRENVPQ